MKQIITSRLIMRHIEEKDFQTIYNIRYSNFVWQYNPMEKKPFKQVAQELLNNQEKIYIMERKSDNQVIGEIMLSQDHLRYRMNSKILSYCLNEHDIKKGYMYEALHAILQAEFNKGIDIISARCFEENIASQKLLEKLGFIQEGRLRLAIKDHKDKIHHDCLYSLQQNELK